MPRKTKNSRAPRVLLLCRYWEERFLLGVAEHAKKAGWILDIALRHDHAWRPPPRTAALRGVIANTQGDPVLDDYLRSVGVPVVLADTLAKVPGAPAVVNTPGIVGEIAAEHFRLLGFERFAFVAPEAWLRSGRAEGFAAALARSGFGCERLALETFSEKFRRLEPPVAMLATNDTAALEALALIENAGLSVPRDIALLGVDDDEILCTLGSTPLSSINLDFEGRGRRCAEILGSLMRGEPAPDSPVHTPARGVVVRRSTDTLAIPDRDAAEALRFIRENYRKPIALKDVARALDRPVRGIQDIFKRHAGRALGEELARLRLEAAKLALCDPKKKLEAIAAECGYSGRTHLSRALKRDAGLSPRAWRRQTANEK